LTLIFTLFCILIFIHLPFCYPVGLDGEIYIFGSISSIQAADAIKLLIAAVEARRLDILHFDWLLLDFSFSALDILKLLLLL